MEAPKAYGDNLADLNKFMLPEYKSGIVEAVKEDPKLALYHRIVEMGVVEKDKFTAGGDCYIGIKTLRPATGAAKGEGANVPRVGITKTNQIYFNTQRVYAVAGVTDEALDRAKGFPASYADLIDEKMDDIKLDMRLTVARQLYGDGTGRLGRVASVTGTTGDGTVTLDNTRTDFGWAGTAFIRPGMTLEFHAGQSSGGVYIHNGSAPAKSAKFYVDSLTDTVLTGVWSEGSGANVADNDLVYVEGEFGISPNGLLNLIDDGLTTTGQKGGSQAGNMFLGLNRTLYPFLQARIYRGSQNGGTDGTAKTWTLDLLDQIDDAMQYGEGGGHITALYVNTAMRRQIRRKGQATASISTPLGTTAAGRKVIPGVSVTEILINDRPVPIIVIPTIPRNTILAPDEREFKLYDRYGMRFVEEGQGPWIHSRDRKHNYEAWLHWDYNIACSRCDNFARVEDLLDNE